MEICVGPLLITSMIRAVPNDMLCCIKIDHNTGCQSVVGGQLIIKSKHQ